MSKLPLVEGVLHYIKENNIRFSMPGHKGGKGFERTAIGKELYRNFIYADITEVEGVDNLHNPSGIIKEAQKCLSTFYGSENSYFLVNGSTSGNLAMIFSTFDEGDKVIVERNCHKSIFNGIILRKLKPVYIKNKISHKYNALLSIDEEHFLSVLNENKDAKGIILTYPNYYGVCPDLKFIIRESRKRNMKILVDAAHGAHFGVCNGLPENPVKLGADMVVMSSHKTLPSLTQSSFLHIGNNVDKGQVEFYLNAFLSTSPSYLLMCSMDYARYYLEEYGEEDYKELIYRCIKYKEEINRIKGLHIIEKKDLENNSLDLDITRYIINLEKGYSASKLAEFLRVNNIQVEMNDSQNVVLIFSPFNDEYEFQRLYEVLKSFPIENFKMAYYNILNYDIPERKLIPYEVVNKSKKSIDIKDSLGKICGEAIIPYPPGVPLVTIGELIDENTIKATQYYLESGIEVMGIKMDNKKYKIQVVEE